MLARPITVMEPTVSEGGKKRFSSLVRESSVMKKPKTSSVACGGLSLAEKLVINLTSPKRKMETAESEFAKATAPKVATIIIERIVQCRSSVVPHVSRFASRRPSRAKFGLAFERLKAMKRGKVDSTTKVAPMPISYSVIASDLPAKKAKTAYMGSCENLMCLLQESS